MVKSGTLTPSLKISIFRSFQTSLINGFEKRHHVEAVVPYQKVAKCFHTIIVPYTLAIAVPFVRNVGARKR